MGKTLTAKSPRSGNGAGLNAALYGKLCAETIPKVIESDEEFDRMVEHLERLTFKHDASPEENALASLLEKLVVDYDDEHYPPSRCPSAQDGPVPDGTARAEAGKPRSCARFACPGVRPCERQSWHQQGPDEEAGGILWGLG